MANRLYGELMGKRSGGKTRNYCYLFSQVTPERAEDTASVQWAWHWYTFCTLKEEEPGTLGLRAGKEDERPVHQDRMPGQS